MQTRLSRWAFALALALVATTGSLWAGDLTFEDRVKAQEAIERVYWSHRIWPQENPQPKPPFEQVVTAEEIRSRVEDYLRKSAALDVFWRRPISADQLRAEMERISRSTRSPASLKEIFEALGDDPVTIAECLARPILADRLVRGWYANDDRFHGALRRHVESLVAEIEDLDETSTDRMRAMDGEYVELTRHVDTKDNGAPAPLWRSDLFSPALQREDELKTIEGVASTPTVHLVEDAESIRITKVISREGTEVRSANVVWRKEAFDDWWRREGPKFSDRIPVISADYRVPALPAESCTEDTWRPTLMDGIDPRGDFSAVWTGTEMIVWGGETSESIAESSALPIVGGRYNPATDTWTPMSKVGAPAGRIFHTAVWTGTEMIIWGGRGWYSTHLNSGGRYNPAADTWTPTRTEGAVPSPRMKHTAIWTGREMIVWGGQQPYPYEALQDGGRYSPSTDSWIPTGRGPNVPMARYEHTAVWTGREMIIWGGYSGTRTLNSGARYRPATDKWRPVRERGAPAPRRGHLAVWSGKVMIIWGSRLEPADGGGRYDPSTNLWQRVRQNPDALGGTTAIWTGKEMIVWPVGGRPVGARYKPSTNTWKLTSPATSSETIYIGQTVVWTGREMIVWGGSNALSGSPLGWRYSPTSDSWVAVGTGSVPGPRVNHSAVWTGSEMIVWGGNWDAALDSGARYDPATNTWSPTERGQGLPPSRYSHSALWTGIEMIVWGGKNGLWGSDGDVVNAGGKYNPQTGTWSPTGSSGTPMPARTGHTAIWTGREMIVWGGTGDPLAGGARYDPSADDWTRVAPPEGMGFRTRHSAVWTGREMIIWGGFSGWEGEPIMEAQGERYDPSNDTWTPVSTIAQPPLTAEHSAVWTGSRMIVWGGWDQLLPWQDAVHAVASGGLYDPATDAWAPISTIGAPDPRVRHTALWTGRDMVVWGGNRGVKDELSNGDLDSGARYDPIGDTWEPTGVDAFTPAPASRHTAVWTESEMIVWGGSSGSAAGGLYCAGIPAVSHRDDDGSGAPLVAK